MAAALAISTLTLASVATLAIARNEHAPEQIHIALAASSPGLGRADGMRVAWYTARLPAATTTTSTTNPTSSQQPLKHTTHSGATFVQYGQTAEEARAGRHVVGGVATQYMAERGYHHAALVAGLPPLTRVFYRVGTNSTAGGWSAVQSFRTAPAGPDTAVRVSIFGDMGYKDSTQRPMEIVADGLKKHWSASHSRRVIGELAAAGAIDAVIHAGDIGYADDTYAHHVASMEYEETYNGFMNWLQNMSASLPYMVSPGNHESENHSPRCLLDLPFCAYKLNNFTAFNQRWHMPAPESGGLPGSNMWYSFDFGPVHFVSMDTETDFPGAGEETHGDSGLLPAGGFGRAGEYAAWLEADLKRASQARAAGAGLPWIIAYGHRPFREIQAQFQPLFDAYKVDMYFCGHGHSYSRSLPAAAGRPVERHHDPHLYSRPNATTYIMVGGAGCDEMAQGDAPSSAGTGNGARGGGPTSNPYLADGAAAPVGATAAVYHNYATGVLEANRTHLSWRLIDSVNGSVVDTLVIH